MVSNSISYRFSAKKISFWTSSSLKWQRIPKQWHPGLALSENACFPTIILIGGILYSSSLRRWRASDISCHVAVRKRFT
ncbi:hypothetical protein BJY00DRAFT_277825 [Aspergillus carlsbadensis]|nr:hypothetical protein BJY00DRAFT_277825 [Aspergillus carlsbadensis]